jgi:hypothetical protein
MLGGPYRWRELDPSVDSGTRARVSSVVLVFFALGAVFDATTRQSVVQAIPDVLGAVVCLVLAVGIWQKRRW